MYRKFRRRESLAQGRANPSGGLNDQRTSCPRVHEADDGSIREYILMTEPTDVFLASGDQARASRC